METFLYPAVLLLAMLYAIHRGHSISFGVHLRPRNRLRR